MPRALKDLRKSQGPICVSNGDPDERTERTRRRPDPTFEGRAYART
jgi:hypothetical protein